MAKLPHTLTETLPDGTSFKMILVEGGEYSMGIGEKYSFRGMGPRHRVKVNSFYISRFLLSDRLYRKARNYGTPEKSIINQAERAVTNIDWYDAIEYCNLLSRLQGYQEVYSISKTEIDVSIWPSDRKRWTVDFKTGANGFRLPTEAEWEFAARGGRYSGSNPSKSLPNESWTSKNSHEIAQPLGLRMPNRLGVYDLTGNVLEWVWDRYSDHYYSECRKKGMSINPVGPNTGQFQSARGGSYIDIEDYSKPFVRFNDFFKSSRFPFLGFRLSRSNDF